MRGKDLEKLKIVIRALIEEEKLDPIHRDHKLVGNWKGRRDAIFNLIGCLSTSKKGPASYSNVQGTL
jgi:hypothetical protein